MKHINRLSLLLLAGLCILMLTGCVGVSLQEEGLVVGESYTLESGETLNNDLTIVGGNAQLEQDSTVNGDLAVIGGNVNIDGTVTGDVSVLGGYVQLKDHAVINGSLSAVGGTVRRADGAVVEGETNPGLPFRITTMRTPPFQINFDPITGPLMAFFQALALAALAILVHLFAAPQMQRTGLAAISQPIASGGVGLLTIIVAPALLLIMAITIILLPLSLLGFLVLGIAALYGWLSLGLMVGRQLAVWLKQPWSDPINAGVGTLVLSLLSSMLNLIPCLGWLANALVWFIALGTVILTRFGMQAYPAPYRTPAPQPTSPATPAPAPVSPPRQVAEVDKPSPQPAVDDADETRPEDRNEDIV